MKDYDGRPWDGFCALREQLGDIYSLQMGVRKIIVLSNLSLMREVLVEKSHLFADRPDFSRYHTIFDGDRENALALCDWSRTQRMRRVVATLVVLPRFSTHLFRQLNYCIKVDMKHFLAYIQRPVNQTNEIMTINKQEHDSNSLRQGTPFRASAMPVMLGKAELLFLFGNIFAHYLCSRR